MSTGPYLVLRGVAGAAASIAAPDFLASYKLFHVWGVRVGSRDFRDYRVPLCFLWGQLLTNSARLKPQEQLRSLPSTLRTREEDAFFRSGF